MQSIKWFNRKNALLSAFCVWFKAKQEDSVKVGSTEILLLAFTTLLDKTLNLFLSALAADLQHFLTGVFSEFELK